MVYRVARYLAFDARREALELGFALSLGLGLDWLLGLAGIASAGGH